MRQLATLAWKEWHETRAFLWIALGIFVGLPMIQALEGGIHYARGFQIDASPWVIYFGGILAVFVGVGVACRDFSGRLEDFWRSRPVGLVRWVLIKFIVGLGVVLIACALPLGLEVAMDNDKRAAVALAWFPFFWSALYSIGFLAGCVIRRVAHAAMLALSAALLVYFLPMILPPLERFSSQSLMSFALPHGSWPVLWSADQIKFGAGMLTLTFAVLGLTILCVRHDCRLESGWKLIYGSISTAVLIVVISAAYHLGTNLPILGQIVLDWRERIVWVRMSGSDGIAEIERFNGVYRNPNGVNSYGYLYSYRAIHLFRSGIELGETVPTPPNEPANARVYDHPATIYWADEANDSRDSSYTYCSVRVIEWNRHDFDSEFDVWGKRPTPPGPWATQREWAEYDEHIPREIADTFIVGNRLYVVGSHLATLDISKPLTPRVISVQPLPKPFRPNFFISDYRFKRGSQIVLDLPPIAELTPRQRLQAVLDTKDQWEPMYSGLRNLIRDPNDANYLCEKQGNSFVAYHLTSLTDDTASYDIVGEYDPTVVETLLGSRSFGDVVLSHGKLYVTEPGYGGIFNPRIAVFDVAGREPMRLAGHFAAPGWNWIYPLPDGRGIVCGSGKAWLVGPPPGVEETP